MTVVTNYKGKLKAYKVKNKRQAYGLALASYKALNGLAWIK
jgi:hypothetical protein